MSMNDVSVLQNRIRSGGFIQSEAAWSRSRDEACIEGGSGGAGVMVPGTVLGQVTATGKYLPASPQASDGSQVAVAVLFDDVDATNGDVVAAVIARDAEVRAEDLVYDSSVTTTAQMFQMWAFLAAVGIEVRPDLADWLSVP
jgi:hypothetical protein